LDLDWRDYVKFDERYLRPSEVDSLRGDATKATLHLGWEPQLGFHELVRMMVDADLELAEREAN
jgi:GDPmannose 4,6-dehydratase